MEWLGVLTSGFDRLGLPWTLGCFAMLCHVNVGKSCGMSRVFKCLTCFAKSWAWMHACCMLFPNIMSFTTVLPNASICVVFAVFAGPVRKHVKIESNQSPRGSVPPLGAQLLHRQGQGCHDIHWISLEPGRCSLPACQYGSIWINILRKPLIGIGTRMWILLNFKRPSSWKELGTRWIRPA